MSYLRDNTNRDGSFQTGQILSRLSSTVLIMSVTLLMLQTVSRALVARAAFTEQRAGYICGKPPKSKVGAAVSESSFK